MDSLPEHEALLETVALAIDDTRSGGAAISHVRVACALDDYRAMPLADKLCSVVAKLGLDWMAILQRRFIQQFILDAGYFIVQELLWIFSTMDLDEQLSAQRIDTFVFSTGGVPLSTVLDAASTTVRFCV
ncbi:hypothetical protein [Rhodococcus globerulus]|uniref:Uncharacterized protein n=1 Tax=Rhodococcus globerulus TaxID=33008 RepID=A0ABU4C508_RHOGO|nr:hypothetical protein [Rhodococcus globerulus]MDV6271602.1 hypothetical protein [Rhodococcus globerulus]